MDEVVALTRSNIEKLRPYARKYLWWKPPEEALRQPLRVIAQVMDLADYGDVQRLIHAVGEAPFKDAIAHAEAGQFQARSWSYWHYRLGLAKPGHLPPRPQRSLSAR